MLIADDTANAQHPPEWFARSEPFACFGPAPFFSEEVTFADGATMKNRYAVVIADGDSDAGRRDSLAAAAVDLLRQQTVEASA